jgi:hypothetical protein
VNLYKTPLPRGFLYHFQFHILYTITSLNMIFSYLSTISCISFASIATARSLAEPATQYLAPRDSPYQGGWPLGLSSSATDTCPANSVACSTTTVNPTCCPAGNTCIWGVGVFQNYCCPTSTCLSHLANQRPPSNMLQQAPTAMKQ